MQKSQDIDERFLRALDCLSSAEAKKTAQKIYDNFDIKNVFWDIISNEIEFLGDGFAITVSDT